MNTIFKSLALSVLLMTYSIIAFTQDSLSPVEPDMETSFENTELLIIALVGLALLLLLYFVFKRRRR
jgi:LPXTG-motif cell wall-anchored protein